VNTSSSIDHDCRIGAHVHVAPGVTLSGGVEVGDGTHIGTGACVIQRIRIASHCFVAAGAVVVRDVAMNAKVAGVPARELLP
jgi:UDP-perosamine 4-acetyltransferase